MWKYYQDAIIKKIFFPYVLYLLLLLILSGCTVRQYCEMFDDDNNGELAEQEANFWWVQTCAAIFTFGAVVHLLYFVSLELP